MTPNSPIRNYIYQLLKAFVAAFTIILCSQYLGAEGRGQLGALLFYVSLITTTSEFVGGSSMANLVVKYPLGKLVPVSYLWALLVNLAGGVILGFFLPIRLITPILLMSFCMSLLSIHFAIYQGLSKTNSKAALQLFYESLKLLLTGIYLVFLFNHSTDGVYTCLWIFGACTFLVALYSFIKLNLGKSLSSELKFPIEIISTGFWSQMGHLAQLFNYRIGILLLINLYNDDKSAGLYSNIVLIADTLWIFANSFGSIAHMRIIQSQNPKFIADITLRYTAISLVVTLVITGIVLLIPAPVYTWLFGHDFAGIKNGLLYFAPGIIALSATASFSNYFHGTGRFKYLFAANLGGFMVQVLLVFLISKTARLETVCLASGAGFITIFLMLFAKFKQQNPGARFQWHSALRGLVRLVKKFV